MPLSINSLGRFSFSINDGAGASVFDKEFEVIARGASDAAIRNANDGHLIRIPLGSSVGGTVPATQAALINALVRAVSGAPQAAPRWADAAGTALTKPDGRRVFFLSDERSNPVSLMPSLAAAAAASSDLSPTVIRIIGLGSSVGVGATLPDTATQAPVARVAAALASTIDKLGNLDLETTNGSVNGTTLFDGKTTDYAAAKVTAGGAPTLAVLAYGMNDGMPAQYHAGQTYPGVYTNLIALVSQIHSDGGDVIVMTTPHPYTAEYDWTAAVGSITYPGASNPIPVLTDEASVVDVTLQDGTVVPASYRHLRVNEQIRRAAVEMRCTLIDVERYWFDAVALYGEAALFDAGELVHPNLLGHQSSYWAAIADSVGLIDFAKHFVPAPVRPIKVIQTAVANGGTMTITVRASSVGRLVIKSTSGGGWVSVWAGSFVSAAAAVQVVVDGTGFIATGNSIASVVGSGSTLDITVTAATTGSGTVFDYYISYL